MVRMDQPYSRMVDMMLDTQYYSTADPTALRRHRLDLRPATQRRHVASCRSFDPRRPDDAGSTARSARPEASTGNGSAWFVLNANAEPALATLRFRLKDVKMFAAEEPFEVEGVKYNAGSFLVPASGNPRRPALATQFGHRVARPAAHAVGSEIKVKRHPVSVPRIALLHTWVNTQNDGWFRLALDECEVPYSYISDQDVRATPDLKSKYDVIIFPPVTTSLPTLINGVRKRLLDDGSDFGGPVPFKSTELTPEPRGCRRIGRYPRRTGLRRARPSEDVRGEGRRVRSRSPRARACPLVWA